MLVKFCITEATAQLNVGIKGGVTLSNINYDNKFNQKTFFQEYNIGYTGGLTLQYYHQKNLGLQADFLFIQKGFKSRYDENTQIQYQRDIDYFTLPFLMNAYFGKKSFTINLLVGVFGSYALNSNEILTEGNTIIDRAYRFDKEIDNRFEVGLQGGIGLKKIFKFGIIQLEGSFAYSLTSIYKWEVSNKDLDMDKFFEIPEQAQNQSLLFTISYLYNFHNLSD